MWDEDERHGVPRGQQETGAPATLHISCWSSHEGLISHSKYGCGLYRCWTEVMICGFAASVGELWSAW